MRANFLFRASICFALLALSAKVTNAQSYYSQRGIGLTRYFTSGQAVGMGGAGLALSDPLTVNYMNPAALTNLSVTFISGNFLHESNSVTATSTTAAISNTNVDGVMFHVPLKSLKMSLAAGLNPHSSIEYGFEGEGGVSSTRYRQVVSGDGGVNTVFLSFAVRPVERVSFGITGLYYFGTLRNIWRVVFSNDSFRNTRSEVSESFAAGNFRLGIQAQPLSNWVVAAVVTPSIKLDANKSVNLFNISNFEDFPDRDIELPLSFGIGTSFFIGPKFLLSADYYREQWSDTNTNGYVNDGKRIGFGFEYSKRGNSFTSSYLSRMAFRAGFSYRDFGLEEPLGEKVTEMFGSIGVGMPIKWTAARLDFALEIGQRGALQENPVRERVVRFSAAITAGEKWFYRGGPR